MNEVLSEGLDKALKEHMAALSETIIKRAYELAESRAPDLADVAKAIAELHASPPPTAVARRVGLLDIVSPITLVSAVLAIVFAAFGLWALSSPNAKELGGGAYLDIAKIFAGAIVGSTGAAATTALRRQSS